VAAVFNQVAVLFIILITGYIVKKARIIDDSFNSGLSNFLMYVSLPSLVITSMNFEFSKQILRNCASILVISLAVYFISIVFSFFVPYIFRIEGKEKGIYRFCTVFPNVGFMGYPIVEALYGREGIFYAVIFNLPFSFLIWTLGVMIISNNNKQKAIDYKKMLNPGTVASTIGLFTFLSSIEFPRPVLKAAEVLGSTTTPLSMTLVGIMLAKLDQNNFVSIANDIKTLGISLIRLVFLPVFTLLVLTFLEYNGLSRAIPVLMTAMPIAPTAVIFSDKYDNDSVLASKAVFASTALSMLTLPLIITLI
jgi:hypothetical protein